MIRNPGSGDAAEANMLAAVHALLHMQQLAARQQHLPAASAFARRQEAKSLGGAPSGGCCRPVCVEMGRVSTRARVLRSVGLLQVENSKS